MEFSSMLHIPKSSYAYALNKNELVVWFRTKKGDCENVKINYCDPFEWYEKSPVIKSELMKKQYETEFHDYFKITLFSKTRRIKYVFRVSDNLTTYEFGSKECILVENSEKNNKSRNFVAFSNYFNFPYINEEDIYVTPSWSKNTIWYQIFPDRFANKDNPVELSWNSTNNVTNNQIYGGNIKGIIDKIPYLKDLGISGIYFTPLFYAGQVHKYDTIDYYKIDPQFGNNEDFRELVLQCHKNGIKVMLDIVFNHCGDLHPMFQDVLENGTKSKYADCFCYIDETKKELYIDGKINYHTFAFTPHMPKLNQNNPIMREYLLDVASFWIKEYDVDGYRLDVSNEVSHHFWKDFNKTCKSLKKDFFILGENWDNSSPWIANDQMDAVMNYEFYYPLIEYFCTDGLQEKINSETFVYLLNNLITSYTYTTLNSMYNLVGSHDTPRIKFKCGENEEIVKLVYVFMFFFTGSPNIYYGDELGLSGSGDPDNRRCMNWDLVGNDFYLFIKKLIKIRQENNDLSYVDIEWIDYKNEKNYIVCKKNSIYLIINNNNEKITIDTKTISGTYENIYTNKEVTIGDSLKLNAYSFLLFR